MVHMKRLSVVETAECQCGSEEQTPFHILQNCPHLEEERQKVWPTEVPYETKLWGDASDLQKTVQFIITSKLKI